jgi:hypothetical protein
VARKRSVGKPPRDDAEALEAVQRIRKAQPRLSYRAAALRYAKEHPEPDAQPESTARRLADKLRAMDGLPRKRRATRRVLLQELKFALARAVFLLEHILDLEEEPPAK